MRGSLTLILLSIEVVIASRILMMPVPYKSHMRSLNSLGQHLRQNGHEVYTAIPGLFKRNPDSIRATGLNILSYDVPLENSCIDPDFQARGILDMIINDTVVHRALTGPIVESCQRMHEDETFLQKVRDLKFDLAVVEGFPLIPCLHIFPHIFNIPHVTVFSWYDATIPGSATLPSFFVGLVPPPTSHHMSFRERLIRTIRDTITNRQMRPLFGRISGLFPELSDITLIEHYQQKGLVSNDIHSWLDFIDESQLYIYFHDDITVQFPKPLYPNMISVGSFTIEDSKPLSGDLEAAVQAAEYGVVVVSIGSIVKGLPVGIIQSLINAFGRRRELFIMNFQRPSHQTEMVLPSNVKLMPWIPQIDLLAHKKTKLFITHSGANGVHEAVYHGVPMLCVPLFGDQFAIAYNVKEKGYGLTFKLKDFTEDEIVDKIEEIISNSAYRKTVAKAGQIMRHKPMSARQTAAFWIEHVLQFGGEHLKPSSVVLTWWQYFCLDTLGLIALVVVFLTWIVCLVLKCVLKTMFKLARTKHDKSD